MGVFFIVLAAICLTAGGAMYTVHRCRLLPGRTGVNDHRYFSLGMVLTDSASVIIKSRTGRVRRQERAHQWGSNVHSSRCSGEASIQWGVSPSPSIFEVRLANDTLFLSTVPGLVPHCINITCRWPTWLRQRRSRMISVMGEAEQILFREAGAGVGVRRSHHQLQSQGNEWQQLQQQLASVRRLVLSCFMRNREALSPAAAKAVDHLLLPGK